MSYLNVDVDATPMYYLRVEEVDAERRLVRLDCTPKDARISLLMSESNEELRLRWRRSFGLEADSPGSSMSLLAEVDSEILTARVTDTELWQSRMVSSKWFRVAVRHLRFAAADLPEVNAEDFEEVPQAEANKLSAILDMVYWPRIPAPQLRAALDDIPAVDGVLVHDVGQGSANALFDSSGKAVLYFDVGRGGLAGTKMVRGGMQGKKKVPSAPSGLELCGCDTPIVVLSHWDMDHWRAAEDGHGHLLESIWVVPSQKIAGRHSKLAIRVLNSGGSIFVVKRSSKPRTATPTGSTMSIQYGQGSDRNNSGLILTVKTSTPRDPLTLFFPGDAKYSMCRWHPLKVDLLVASHHGADPGSAATPPGPMNPGSSRLVYSFGLPNGYGHPAPVAVTAHNSQGWNDVVGNHSGRNKSPNSGDVRATYSTAEKVWQSIVFPAGALSQARHFNAAHGEALSC